MNRRLLSVTIVLALFFTFSTMSVPTRVQAAAGCGSVSGVSGGSVTFTNITPFVCVQTVERVPS